MLAAAVRGCKNLNINLLTNHPLWESKAHSLWYTPTQSYPMVAMMLVCHVNVSHAVSKWNLSLLAFPAGETAGPKVLPGNNIIISWYYIFKCLSQFQVEYEPVDNEEAEVVESLKFSIGLPSFTPARPWRRSRKFTGKKMQSLQTIIKQETALHLAMMETSLHQTVVAATGDAPGISTSYISEFVISSTSV